MISSHYPFEKEASFPPPHQKKVHGCSCDLSTLKPVGTPRTFFYECEGKHTWIAKSRITKILNPKSDEQNRMAEQKITSDLYEELSGDRIIVGKGRLVCLPIIDIHSPLKDRLCVKKSGIKTALRFAYERLTNAKSLADTKTIDPDTGEPVFFIDYLDKYHRPPEHLQISSPDSEADELVPLVGFMHLLAIAQVLGDPDPITYSGVVLQDKNSFAKVVKINQGKLCLYFNNLLDDKGWLFEPLIKWDALTLNQKDEFVTSLEYCLEKLNQSSLQVQELFKPDHTNSFAQLCESTKELSKIYLSDPPLHIPRSCLVKPKPMQWEECESPFIENLLVTEEIAPKGSASIAFYKDEPTGTKWLVKLTPIEDDLHQNACKSLNIASIKEKIGADLYSKLGLGTFIIPTTKLTRLLVSHEVNSDEIPWVDDRKFTNMQSLRVASAFISDLVHFADIETTPPEGGFIRFMDYIRQYHKLPEKIWTPGPDKRSLVPLRGCCALLAIGKILGDTDLFGGSGHNAGIKWCYNQSRQISHAETVKVDPGSVFDFVLMRKVNEPQDIRIGEDSDKNTLFIEWKSLTREQKTIFSSNLLNAAHYLNKSNKARLQSLFCQARNFTEPSWKAVAAGIVEEITEWMSNQLTHYQCNLVEFAESYPDYQFKLHYMSATYQESCLDQFSGLFIFPSIRCAHADFEFSYDLLCPNPGTPLRTLILGKEGIGKSALCQKIAQDSASIDALTNHYDAVYWVRLDLFESDTDFHQRIYQSEPLSCLAYMIAKTCNDTLYYGLQAQLGTKAHRVLILLDGYERATKGCQELVEKLLSLPLHFLITSQARCSIAGFEMKTYDLVGFSDSQRKNYVKNFFRHKYSKDASEKEERFWQTIDNFSKLDPPDFLPTPTELSFLCSLWRDEIQPTELTIPNLYESTLRRLFHIQQKQNRLKQESHSIKHEELVKAWHQIGKLAQEAKKGSTLIVRECDKILYQTGLFRKVSNQHIYRFLTPSLRDHMALNWGVPLNHESEQKVLHPKANSMEGDQDQQIVEWSAKTIAEKLWMNPQLDHSTLEKRIPEINAISRYLSERGFKLQGIPSDGNCFFHAWYNSYLDLKKKGVSIPLLDERDNVIDYLRKIAFEGKKPDLLKDGSWVNSSEGASFVKILQFPTRLLNVQISSENTVITTDLLRYAGSNFEEVNYDNSEDKPKNYVFIVDLNHHFVYATKSDQAGPIF